MVRVCTPILNLLILVVRVCYSPSLLFSEFVMVRVCYGPSCPVTVMISVRNGKRVKFRPQKKKNPNMS